MHKPKVLRQQEKIIRALIKLHLNVKMGEFLRSAYWNHNALPINQVDLRPIIKALYSLDTQALALEKVLRALSCPECLKFTLNATIKPLPFFPKIDLQGEIVLKDNFYPTQKPFAQRGNL